MIYLEIRLAVRTWQSVTNTPESPENFPPGFQLVLCLHDEGAQIEEWVPEVHHVQSPAPLLAYHHQWWEKW